MSVLKNIQYIWLNRRTTKLEPFILAVEAFSDAILRSYSNSTDFCTRKYSLPHRKPLPEPSCPSFTAYSFSLTLRGDFEVWEEPNKDGIAICKGIRHAGSVLGHWTMVSGPRRISMDQIYLMNSEAGSRHQIRIVDSADVESCNKSNLLALGKTIVWRTGENGCVATGRA